MDCQEWSLQPPLIVSPPLKDVRMRHLSMLAEPSNSCRPSENVMDIIRSIDQYQEDLPFSRGNQLLFLPGFCPYS